MQLTCPDLFALVWHTPLTRLAAVAGVSDVAVKKWLRKRGIPTPARGHWAKVQAGLVVPRPQMPTMWPNVAPVKISVAGQDELEAMLRDARAAMTTCDRAESANKSEESASTQQKFQIRPPNGASQTLGDPNSGGSVSILDQIDFEAISAQQRKVDAILRIGECSAHLDDLDRLKVEAWLAQARLELEKNDPARILIQRLTNRKPPD
ncbi:MULTISPECIES: hypothetical protein [Roseateles]|uniref:hypothetical protein n=1 Tax=Roseateles TaxID=93681 RepID=UPI000FBCE49E|nr:hypothetical protein [Roseateles puraquae]MDG0853859.1 hypothetical protein [Roseateles puraquae]RTL22487.1 MAG: hypothetical protein EKK52_06145 [Burkholderiales bacterium]